MSHFVAIEEEVSEQSWRLSATVFSAQIEPDNSKNQEQFEDLN